MERYVSSRLALFALVAVGLFATVGATWPAGHGHHRRCQSDCCQVCCMPCPPPPVEMTFCLQDPCNCCVYEACVCVPACCAGEQPCVTWKQGILGRQIATLCWQCCGHEAKVVVTKHGKVRVRG